MRGVERRVSPESCIGVDHCRDCLSTNFGTRLMQDSLNRELGVAGNGLWRKDGAVDFVQAGSI